MHDVLSCDEIARRYAIVASRDFNMLRDETLAIMQRAIVGAFWQGRLPLWTPETAPMRILSGDDDPIDPRDVIWLLHGSWGYLPDLDELCDDVPMSHVEGESRAEGVAAPGVDLSPARAAIDPSDPWHRDRRNGTLDLMMASFARRPPFGPKLWKLLGPFKTTRAAFGEFYNQAGVWPAPNLETWWRAGDSRPSAKRKTGPKKGSGRYVGADRAVYPLIETGVKSGKNLPDVIGELIDEGKVTGGGERKSTAKRLGDRYRKEAKIAVDIPDQN